MDPNYYAQYDYNTNSEYPMINYEYYDSTLASPSSTICQATQYYETSHVPLITNKVLVNPNFMRAKVHVNPKYVKPSSIFVNPQVLAASNLHRQYALPVAPTPPSPPMPPVIYTAKPAACVSTKTKWIRHPIMNPEPYWKTTSATSSHQSHSSMSSLKPQHTYQPAQQKWTYSYSKSNVPSIGTKPINIAPQLNRPTSSKYKLVRNNVSYSSTPPRKRRTSLILRNKIIHTHAPIKRKDNLSSMFSRPIFKSKFKIDRRSPSGERSRNKAFRSQVDHRSTILKKIRVAAKVSRGCTKKLISISGRKYKLCDNQMRLRLVDSKLSTKNKVATVKATEVKNPKLLRKKLKKNNIPCPSFKKFGMCPRYSRGTCSKAHNPKQIDLCINFLKGNCTNASCLLSHDATPAKMPICHFFLQGLCVKDNCPYLHVKINPKTAICPEFLHGYCARGSECEKRHQFRCPQFEINGKCAKGHQCLLPHVRRSRPVPSKTAAKPIYKSNRSSKVKRLKKSGSPKKKVKEADPAQNSVRYYNEYAGNGEETDVVVDAKIETPEPVTDQKLPVDDEVIVEKVNVAATEPEMVSSSSSSSTLTNLKKRKQVGELPTFIPF